MSVKAPEPRSSRRWKPKKRSKNAARPVTSEVVRLRCLRCIMCRPFEFEERTKADADGATETGTTARRQRDETVTPSDRGSKPRKAVDRAPDDREPAGLTNP